MVKNDITVDVYLDGENVTVDSHSFLKPTNKEMEMEMFYFSLNEMKNIDSNSDSLKGGITKIGKVHGYTVTDVNIKSPYGEDQLPLPVVVDGDSMIPTLQDGEELVILKTNKFKPGDVVISKHPQYELIIKRINKTQGNKVYLMSDNRRVVIKDGYIYKGLDTWVNRSQIIGVYKLKIS